MFTNLYQEYLYLIGKLKDIYKLTVDVDHRDIHTFLTGKRPVFKLFFGTFEKDAAPSIVVSFHIELGHHEVIQWFLKIRSLHPMLQLHDSYIEDGDGLYHLGEEALTIQKIYRAQEILREWLNNKTIEEIEDFSQSKVEVKERDPNRSFNSQLEHHKAMMEFDSMRKPNEDEEVH